jgi:hypothetical protein
MSDHFEGGCICGAVRSVATMGGVVPLPELSEA